MIHYVGQRQRRDGQPYLIDLQQTQLQDETECFHRVHATPLQQTNKTKETKKQRCYQRRKVRAKRNETRSTSALCTYCIANVQTCACVSRSRKRKPSRVMSYPERDL